MNLQRLRETLIAHEGVRLKVYDDATGETIGPGTLVQGIPTIGAGRNLLDRGLTSQEAHQLLDHDIARTVAELHWRFPWSTYLDAMRQEVLANMLFNLGLNRLRGFKRMLAAAEAGDYERAAAEMLDSKWAKQVGKRAVELAEAMRTGGE